MHIMHVVDSLARGGAERSLIEIANHAHGDGHQVSVCVTRSNCDLADELTEGIALYSLNRQKRFDWTAMRRFARIVRDQQVDVLHLYNRPTIAFVAFMKTFRLLPRRIPVVFYDQRGVYLDAHVPRWLRLWGHRYLNHYVGMYEGLIEWAKAAGIPPDRISVIDNALSSERLQQAPSLNVRREFGLSERHLIGVVVGGLRQEKGITVLLDALIECSTRDRVHILIVGGDRNRTYAQTCREKAVASGLTGMVTFAGERADVPSLLHGCDFAIMPSISEGGPNVLVEYMFAGLPFVSTLVGGISLKLAKLDMPEFVSPNDASALATAIDRLVQLSPEARSQRGRQGQALAHQHYDINQIMPKWYAVYNRVKSQ